MASQALSFDELFDPDFLTALQAFTLRARRVHAGGRHAEHMSKARGAGLEFADFKAYVPGDDLRAIDWNIYRRLGRIFVRVFEEQQDLPIYLLVDLSSSMFLGEEPRIKAALRSALALAAIGLGQHDAVGLFSFSKGLTIKVKSTSGKRGLMTFGRQLAALHEESETNLVDAVSQFSNYSLRPGLLVIVSDFFDPAGIDAVLDAMKSCRHRLLMVQMTKAADADPSRDESLQGDVRLKDCESGDSVDVTITPAILARYREIYQSFNDQITQFASKRGAGYVQISADEDVLEQLGRLFEAGSGSLVV